jgi:hypothetical protein
LDGSMWRMASGGSGRRRSCARYQRIAGGVTFCASG